MGLNGAGLNRFRGKIDAVLIDMFPATFLIAAATVAGMCPGGRVVTDYVEAGESTNFRFPIRIPVANLEVCPTVGSSVDWVVSETLTIPLEVIEAPIRPHEATWSLTCKKRRV